MATRRHRAEAQGMLKGKSGQGCQQKPSIFDEVHTIMEKPRRHRGSVTAVSTQGLTPQCQTLENFPMACYSI